MASIEKTSWPKWASAHVEIVAADPAWQRMGVALVEELRELLAPWLRGEVHHVGSTAVPDLPAKPIIDVMADVPALSVAAEIAEAGCGWSYVRPELDQRDWRRFFVKVADDRRVAHLHLMCAEHPRWAKQLAFRDRLRGSPRLRHEYTELKRKLAATHPNDREAYSHGKTVFVARALAEPM